MPNIVMSTPPQTPDPVVEYPHKSLEEWISQHGKDNFVKVICGETYIASHVWSSTTHKVETFGESTVEDDAQSRLTGFLDRNVGVWSKKVEDRRAVWRKSTPRPRAHCQMRF